MISWLFIIDFKFNFSFNNCTQYFLVRCAEAILKILNNSVNLGSVIREFSLRKIAGTVHSPKTCFQYNPAALLTDMQTECAQTNKLITIPTGTRKLHFLWGARDARVINSPLTAGFFTRLAVILYYNRADLPTCIKSLNTMSRITDVREQKRERGRGSLCNNLPGERERAPITASSAKIPIWRGRPSWITRQAAPSRLTSRNNKRARWCKVVHTGFPPRRAEA